MKIRAKKSFCGVLTMGAGEVREYGNKSVLEDLLAADYIEEVKDIDDVADAKPKKRGVKSGESK